jgi:intergrase/recombinase
MKLISIESDWNITEPSVSRAKAGTRMYEQRSNSLRNFFRSRMAFLGVERDYIDYTMGHKTDNYLDVQMMGIEYLRHAFY